MKKRGINARMVAELLSITQSSIFEWQVTGKIPARHMRHLLALTKKATDAKKRWIKYDLVTLREKLGMGQTELAEELGVKYRRLAFWEREGKVLRTLMPRIRELERDARE